ncbi:hypothetical protein thalar_03289 [Litoreibacter arenae DSM 19593]|uniref:Uncharacterized protein n=1 Tax=Litoreibacter arenae DSM 19593 TaxID=1123360 RepID=S9RUF8_9RHOB|nr:hypothetical protein thalar_03289 [Litoreibacter arenae DSM 19593]
MPQDVSIALAAVSLSLIGGAYIGFGARSDSFPAFAMELVVASMFGMAALTGLFLHWSAIPIGLTLHAVWDLLHHNPRFGATVPRWYIPLCIVFDLAAALFFIILYAV